MTHKEILADLLANIQTYDEKLDEAEVVPGVENYNALIEITLRAVRRVRDLEREGAGI